MRNPDKPDIIVTIVFAIVAIWLIMSLTGCGTPHTLRFTKTENGSTISTDPDDKSFGLFRKSLPKGNYAVKPSEYGVEGIADLKIDLKLMEVVVNKNEGL